MTAAMVTNHLGPKATFETMAEVRDAFGAIMRAIAMACGPHCEVVMHDLTARNVDLGHTIAAIENGHVTGREVGGPSTNLGLGVIAQQGVDHDAFGYRGATTDGRELRCSSVYFRNRAGRVIAALCINFDVSPLQQARALVDGMLAQPVSSAVDKPDEYIGRDLSAVLDAMISEAIDDSGIPVPQMSRTDRIAVLRRLDGQGALRMRKAVDSIAARLAISRVTVYSYLDEARNHATK